MQLYDKAGCILVHDLVAFSIHRSLEFARVVSSYGNVVLIEFGRRNSSLIG